MNSMRFSLNLRFLPSTRSRIAPARRFQTSIIAAVALCAAVLAAGTPVFAASRNATSPSPSKSDQMAPTISPEEAAAQHQTLKYAAVVAEGDSQVAAMTFAVDSTSYYGTWTVYPDATKLLVSFVAYNKYCQEVTPGYWTEGSIGPKYGEVAQGLVKGRLSNGDCSQYIFTGAGIYYKWVYHTGSTHNDEFKANWHGGGLENMVTFYLKDR
jgi:hypothetical protein